MRNQLFFVVLGSAGAVYLGSHHSMADRGPRPALIVKGASHSPKSTSSLRGYVESKQDPSNQSTTVRADDSQTLHPDLSAMRLVGDHFEAPLPDGRIAELTLDPKLQAFAQSRLKDAAAPRGAVVVMSPDGKLLALAGQAIESEQTAATDDVSLATDTWAPAASIFKLVSAASLLAAGVGAKDKVCYHGGVRSVMESNLSDSKKDDACADLTLGVASSQNAIMGKLAYQRLSPTSLRATALAFGFGGPISPQLPGSVGQIELSEHKDLAFAKNAAGFLGSRLSALGGAMLANVAASGGLKVSPTIIRAIILPDGTRLTPPVIPAPRAISSQDATSLATMMTQTCEVGSASKSFRRRAGYGSDMTAAGKTGTLSTNEPFPMEISWFVGFAPAQNPKFTVSVVLGNGENWRVKGHTVAAAILDRAIKHDRQLQQADSAVLRKVQW
jgi:penicillin-binding protein A